ncbi:hypothetical protein DPMN_069859 [Dreissena polymorpha]|uniref:Uncharacterized protein n=1 Tax=Dreissena polymorpha TaxID=45954 RepID=A0A9D3Z433_DREPO|nr:hypothetical protein DPMN_069859 [Dreissena polymorpha]
MVQVCHFMAITRTFSGADIGNHLLNRWIKYCSDLYKYPLRPDPSPLQKDPRPEANEDIHATLKLFQCLKAGILGERTMSIIS